MKKISLTGIKPTGTPHLGNYLGAIRPALELSKTYDTVYFIADYHALTTVQNGAEMRANIYKIAATWLALGLNPEEGLFYKQSDIPEIFELSWALSCFTPKGFMNRAHAYKDKVAKNEAAGEDPDANVNMGLYCYPCLMDADILMFSADIVPVGKDQKQHVEFARDIAINRLRTAHAVHRNFPRYMRNRPQRHCKTLHRTAHLASRRPHSAHWHERTHEKATGRLRDGKGSALSARHTSHSRLLRFERSHMASWLQNRRLSSSGIA